MTPPAITSLICLAGLALFVYLGVRTESGLMYAFAGWFVFWGARSTWELWRRGIQA